MSTDTATARVKRTVTPPPDYTIVDTERGMNFPKTQRLQPSGNVMDYPKMGPLVGITHRRRRDFRVGGRTLTFFIVLHGAYDALGLIGSECNGIGVLCFNDNTVRMASHFRMDTGYHGPRQAQIDEWDRVCRLPWKEFREYVNTNNDGRTPI